MYLLMSNFAFIPSCLYPNHKCVFFFFFKISFIYFWLHWVFVAVCCLSLVALQGRYAKCDGFSCCRAQAVGYPVLVVSLDG